MVSRAALYTLKGLLWGWCRPHRSEPFGHLEKNASEIPEIIFIVRNALGSPLEPTVFVDVHVESSQQSHQEVIISSNLYGKLKFKETENLSKTIFHLSVGGELQTDQPSSKPCVHAMKDTKSSMFTESRCSPFGGVSDEAPGVLPSGLVAVLPVWGQYWAQSVFLRLHGFRVFQRNKWGGYRFVLLWPFSLTLESRIPQPWIWGDLWVPWNFSSPDGPSTVLIPNRLFLGLPKLGLGVMKEMSEPTTGALEAVFGISQDRYLNSL